MFQKDGVHIYNRIQPSDNSSVLRIFKIEELKKSNNGVIYLFFYEEKEIDLTIKKIMLNYFSSFF